MRLPSLSGLSKNRVEQRLLRLLDRLVATWTQPESAILVTGFWRSGTTWLQGLVAEAAKAKPVFEPLHWSIDSYSKAVRSDFSLTSEDDLFVNSFMPYCRAPLQTYPALAAYIHQALIGGITHSWVRRGREGWTDAVRGRTVVKFVRGHLLIPAIHDAFSPSHVHIRRDPRAVVASIQRNDWGWWMRDLSLEDQLLQPEDGRSEYFRKWEEEINTYDRESFTSRAAAYWALTERFIQDRVLPVTGGELVSYEELCSRQEEYVSAQLSLFLDSTPEAPAHGDVEEDSPTTEPDRQNVSMEERLYGWKEELPRSESEHISSIAEKFGVSPAIQS